MSTVQKKKGLKEAFAVFFESPSRENLRKLLIDHTGEHDDLDFKKEWISPDVLAKHILAMANKSGGVIMFGIEEKSDQGLEAVGIELDDKTQFLRNINSYVPDEKLDYHVHDFSFEDSEYPKIKGKSFRVLIVEYRPEYIPYLSKKDGKDIKKNSIYIRHNASTIQAEYNHLQDIFNRRLETTFSSAREMSLMEHFKELKDIYSLIKKGDWIDPYYENFHHWDDDLAFEDNPKYPQEDFEDFVVRMIELKKSVIQSIVTADKYMR